MKAINMLFLSSVSLLVLNGCMSTEHVLGERKIDYDKASGGGRYSILQDHAPTEDINVDHLPDIVPQWEPKSRGGNKSPYEVWGEKYWVIDSAEGYVAEGTASWYGNKFHGHKTSNGEIYDMYAFSAAHKSLPLPSFVKVTNLDNQRSIVVRVNDRGPFHGDRLIDLSYAAAARLDYHKKGLARVRVEAITPAKGGNSPVAREEVASVSSQAVSASRNTTTTTRNAAPSSSLVFSHLQVGAFSTDVPANGLKRRLFEAFDTRVNVSINKQSDGLYKVLLGPFDGDVSLSEWQQELQQAGFGSAVRVALTP